MDKLTTAIYTEAVAKVEASKVTGRRVSISGMLKFLGVSRSGYRAFLHADHPTTINVSMHLKRKSGRSMKLLTKLWCSKKSQSKLRKHGKIISERTVGKIYMKGMGIKAQWVKPWITTTRDSDFSRELHNILDEIQSGQAQCGLVYGYYIHLDLRRLCLFDQCYGLVCS